MCWMWEMGWFRLNENLKSFAPHAYCRKQLPVQMFVVVSNRLQDQYGNAELCNVYERLVEIQQLKRMVFFLTNGYHLL